MKDRPILRRSLYSLFWLPTAIVFTEYFAVIKQVKGPSMQPTLNPNTSEWQDVIIFDRYHAKVMPQYERGDIVAVWSPSDPNRLFVKRIIALAGDIVKTLPPYPDAEVRVPEGHVWIEGDERFHSDDSNKFGPVPLALIDSKLFYIIFPLDRIGPVPSHRKHRTDLPRGPAWRHEQADIERQRWRESRVTIGS
ncbi:LexA/Signal peptidase [Gloeophyllum trabeum ATCC 11539]|uniref:Mitochondrial inner membrane protease subunit 2 n=1 Tax=Gloeophyllum trabeum (strain ATCC 11539 / FP-39264 / Madison 617) TaxID=670483 RepID=S7RWN3_GLOTA|nr:LexA/Signal peptidase [Gloeophyllum trabeum ATCC 11539]EPQ59315.1 LexA/Signal peptidase [Gloeophyllum trabeum ATCC 11539]